MRLIRHDTYHTDECQIRENLENSKITKLHINLNKTIDELNTFEIVTNKQTTTTKQKRKRNTHRYS